MKAQELAVISSLLHDASRALPPVSFRSGTTTASAPAGG
jgi:hypothetical protein